MLGDEDEQERLIVAMAVSPTHPDQVYLCTQEAVYRFNESEAAAAGVNPLTLIVTGAALKDAGLAASSDSGDGGDSGDSGDSSGGGREFFEISSLLIESNGEALIIANSYAIVRVLVPVRRNYQSVDGSVSSLYRTGNKRNEYGTRMVWDRSPRTKPDAAVFWLHSNRQKKIGRVDLATQNETEFRLPRAIDTPTDILCTASGVLLVWSARNGDLHVFDPRFRDSEYIESAGGGSDEPDEPWDAPLHPLVLVESERAVYIVQAFDSASKTNALTRITLPPQCFPLTAS